MPKQFSLRLMLVAVTAFCIALGAWSVPAERQQRAVKAIEAAGGQVWYESQFVTTDETFLRRKGPAARQRWLPQHYVDKVTLVFLGGSQVTDDTLAHLKALTTLTHLGLFRTSITDAGLLHLEGLPNLQGLSLDHTRVTDAGLAHLQGLRNLQHLDLTDTRVTDDGVARLQKALPRCDIWTETETSWIHGSTSGF